MSLAPMRYHETCRNMPDISSSFKASPQSLCQGGAAVLAWGCPKKEVREAARHPVERHGWSAVSRCRASYSGGHFALQDEESWKMRIRRGDVWNYGIFFHSTTHLFVRPKFGPFTKTNDWTCSSSSPFLIHSWNSCAVPPVHLRMGEDHGQSLLGFLDSLHVTCLASGVFHPIHCHPSLMSGSVLP